MAAVYFPQSELPPLHVAAKKAGLAIGDIIMFASISPEQQADSERAELKTVLSPYMDLGELAVNSAPRTPRMLRSV